MWMPTYCGPLPHRACVSRSCACTIVACKLATTRSFLLTYLLTYLACDDALCDLANGCPRLRHLDLSLTGVSCAAVHSIACARGADLEALQLLGCNAIDDASVIDIAAHCPQLRVLDLSFCTAVGDEAIEAVGNSCANLHTLCVSPKLIDGI